MISSCTNYSCIWTPTPAVRRLCECGKLSGNAAESGNGICPAVRSAAAFADQRRQPLGMESGPVAVGKGGELRCGPMKKAAIPVRIKTPNARTAKYIISQLGGPDGELAASLRYMHQRYTAKPDKVKGILTDISTEELSHVEMISAILYQLTDGLTPEQIKEAGFDAYFVDHTLGLYPRVPPAYRSRLPISSPRGIRSPT